MCLYDKVVQLCKIKGVTIYQMCKENNLNQTAISNWKNRPNAIPSLDYAVALAKYFNVEEEFFLKE